ncbi:MAG: CHASE2 domain-containing protein [Elainellaceae cyanobacterium]
MVGPIRGESTQSGQPGAQPAGQRFGRLRAFRNGRFTVGLLTTLIVLGIHALGGWRSLDYVGYMLLFQARQVVAPLQWDSRVAVITISDETLGQYGQFPISREHYVELLDRLVFAQPAAVGFDLLFVDPSPYDDALAKAIAKQWTVVLPVTASAQGDALPPVPQLAAAAAAQGHVLVNSDADGVTRSIALYQGEVPAFSLALARIYRESQVVTAAQTPINSAAAIAADPNRAQPFWLNWPGPIQAPSGCALPKPGQLPIYAMNCVLSGAVPGDAFRNRVVLIGVTATGIDPLRTPFNLTPPASNVYLHAAALDNLLNGRSLSRPPGWALVPIVGLLSLVSANIVSRPRWFRLVIFGFPTAWGVITLFGFLVRVWLPIAAPVSTIVLAAIGAQISAQREKQQLMELFSIHVDPGAAELLWQQRHSILQSGQLPAQDIVATVLFIDIRGFTTIAEQLPSQALMRWLNRYLDAITDQITAQGGIVDKFIGDEVMAYFGVPAVQADSATVHACTLRAVEACLNIHDRLQQLNQQLLREGYAPVQIGTGIHTGPVTAGSVGSRHRLNYSIIGDTVNVASRLEELNKVVTSDNPYSLLMTEATYQVLGDRYPCRCVGHFKLKGRSQEVSVYALQRISLETALS